MGDDRRGKKMGDEAALLEDEITTLSQIEQAQSSNRAPSKWEICRVTMQTV